MLLNGIQLILLHSKRPKLHRGLAVLGAIGLNVDGAVMPHNPILGSPVQADLWC